ncbi:class I SAM-dependent methyltransferase [Halomarina halobia]|uniref:Class I SAM-dependent methyltransferase n=1 Tax=Halomarina halobia TaxID=3033386 RepID=A0ABD6ABF3_9EURY|nr:class I SAM-dependent methyltransferase [Halomarina sp. PSR21]
MPTQDRTDPAVRELLLLHVARRTGAMEALARTTGTVQGVARETGIEERAARLLVEALAERGFLKRLGGEYQPTNRTLGFLAKTDVRSIGRLPHELDALDAWLALPETMRTGERPSGASRRPSASGDSERPERSPDWTRNAMGAAAARDEAAVRAAVTAAVRYYPRAERVLVLADGPGRHAVEFARRGYDAHLLDAPEVTEVNEAALEHEAVSLAAGDPLDGGAYPEADLVFAVGLLSRYGAAHLRRVFANARGTLTDDGVAVFVGSVRGETPGAALRALHGYALHGEGGAHTADELTGWLAEAGLAPDVIEIPGLDDRAVAGRVVD